MIVYVDLRVGFKVKDGVTPPPETLAAFVEGAFDVGSDNTDKDPPYDQIKGVTVRSWKASYIGEAASDEPVRQS